MNVNQLKQTNESPSILTDVEILRLIDEGDRRAETFLIEKYKSLVLSKVRTYFIIGADREDIIQEGLIGLYNAIRDFDKDRLASFKGFAELCITRQIITAIKTATRQKHIPLNSSLSLDKPIHNEDSDQTLLDIVAETKGVNPEELLISRERFISIELKLSESLSKLEKKVLHLYLEGYSYQEISGRMNRHVKSIDNALQRVKKKFEEFVEMDVLSF